MLTKALILLIAAALAMAVYPLLNERTWSSCAAVEKRFIGLVLAVSDAGDVLGEATAKENLGVGNGKLAEAAAIQAKPGIAAFFCSLAPFLNGTMRRLTYGNYVPTLPGWATRFTFTRARISTGFMPGLMKAVWWPIAKRAASIVCSVFHP